jgi:predicted GIY-YIG superfamily endonuclease
MSNLRTSEVSLTRLILRETLRAAVKSEAKELCAVSPITAPITWVYSPRRRTTLHFHLPTCMYEASEGDVTERIASTRCGLQINQFASSLTEPGHLQLCDDCALADVIKPSVYRFFDESGRLLYLGCSENLFARFAQHGSPSSQSASWWQLRHTCTVTTYQTAYEAFRAETAAIEAERPPFALPRKKSMRLVST